MIVTTGGTTRPVYSPGRAQVNASTGSTADPPFRLVFSSSWRNARIASHESRFLARHHSHNRTNRTPHPFEISLQTPTSESWIFPLLFKIFLVFCHSSNDFSSVCISCCFNWLTPLKEESVQESVCLFRERPHDHWATLRPALLLKWCNKIDARQSWWCNAHR